jgi:hypothetical protein
MKVLVTKVVLHFKYYVSLFYFKFFELEKTSFGVKQSLFSFEFNF